MVKFRRRKGDRPFNGSTSQGSDKNPNPPKDGKTKEGPPVKRAKVIKGVAGKKLPSYGVVE